MSPPQQRWTITEGAFTRLLARLADDPEAAGREYTAIRHRLVLFFAMRGASSAETLADEAFDRVARRLEEGEPIERLRSYLFGIAKRILLEDARRRVREQALSQAPPLVAPHAELEESEERVASLRRCLAALPPRSRALILGYYEDAGKSFLKERKALARRLEISYGALKTRAHRIRNALAECLRRSLERDPAVTKLPPATRDREGS